MEAPVAEFVASKWIRILHSNIGVGKLCKIYYQRIGSLNINRLPSHVIDQVCLWHFSVEVHPGNGLVATRTPKYKISLDSHGGSSFEARNVSFIHNRGLCIHERVMGKPFPMKWPCRRGPRILDVYRDPHYLAGRSVGGRKANTGHCQVHVA